MPVLAALACLVCLWPALAVGTAGFAGFPVPGPAEGTEFGLATAAGVALGTVATAVFGRRSPHAREFGCGGVS